jgi:hypothetical protein
MVFLSRIVALMLAISLVACAAPPRPPAPPPPPKRAAPSPEHAVYRFDFTLATEGGQQPTAFTLNLEEMNRGEVRLGKNVALAPGGGARQDVGLRIDAEFRTIGESVLLDVGTEMSRIDPSAVIQKTTMKSKALVAPNKPVVVSSIDNESGRLHLTVTATKLR